MEHTSNYDHLVHIKSHDELALYELIPNVVWFFDLDKHGWWWGNQATVDFWGLDDVQQLIDKDLSGDTQGAKDRTAQTFELAVKNGLTIDPWTTYPNGKPKTVFMMHRAVLLGPEKHRGIIAFINEKVELGEQPENLLLVEAMRYTRVAATTFTDQGEVVIENPAATEAYAHLNSQPLPKGVSAFVARFADPEQGRECLAKAIADQGGRWDYVMRTTQGDRQHALDVRRTRHPLTGEFLLLVVEYDVTELYQALQEVEQARKKLHDIAMTDTLTQVASLHHMQEVAKQALDDAAQKGERVRVLFIDLDGFKEINDQYGHDIGDEVLKIVARRIQASIRASDMLARIGGDEFVILQFGVEDTEQVAARTLSHLAEPIAVQGGTIKVNASIGIASYPEDADNLKDLLKLADDAMYQVKSSGKNAFLFASA
ncbi:diguanylate cyclase [Vibrio galatheae]|uniref:Diguanylate cyclase n=1 Tax=Vibrio galatheae TaxID=579748 RepID=A0A0F4NIC6_9VIBR|nr:GGDEF domain-containing protein [Vibrio galatheae]KJY82885.1 diguanylate cyclase [Vibrio galatheae]